MTRHTKHGIPQAVGSLSVSLILTRTWLTVGAFALALLGEPALAAGAGPGAHSDPVASVGLSLVIILTVAKLGSDLAARAGQPGVLGELIGGVTLGSLTLVGFSGFDHVKVDPFIDMLARIGAIILLFEVGLESATDLCS